MGALADEFVRIRADTSYLSKDLKKEGKKSGDNLGKGILGGMKGILGPVSGILAGLGVLTFLKDASAAARESMKIGKQTQAVLKSTGGAAGITAKQIEGMASRLSHLTGVDDEVIQSGENMLLTFTNIRNDLKKGNMVFDEATGIMLDMSVALGQDTKTSAIQLGKALNDPIKGIGALSRVGVTFTEKQKDTIKHLVKTGKTAEAQRVILAELRKEFGGSAAAQATWADKMKVAFGNVQEVVGGFLNKALDPVAKWFVEEGIPAIQDFFDKIANDKNLKTAVTNLKVALQTLTGDQDFRKALTDTATAIPPIVQGLADIVTKYGEIAAAVDKFENMSFAGGDKRGGPVGQIVKDFKAGGTIETALIHFRTAAPRWVKQAWADVTAAFKEDTQFVGQFVGIFGSGGTIETTLIRFRTKVVTGFTDMWNDIKPRFLSNETEVSNGVANFGDKVAGLFNSLKDRVAAWVDRMWADARASFLKNFGFIIAAVQRWAAQVAAWFGKLKSQVVAWVQRMWADARASFIRNHSQIAAGVARWVGQVAGLFTNLKNRVVATVTDLSTRLRTGVTNMLNTLRTRFGEAVNAIGRIWDGIKEKARVPVAFVVNTVINGGLLKAVRAISKFVGYKAGENMSVSMARGGVLPGYSPGKDIHRFYSATGGVLDLSGGEGIARPEIVRAVGRNRWDRMNAAAAHGRLSQAQGYLGGFAQGTSFLGGTRPVPPGSTNQHSGYSWATWAGDLGAGMNTPVHAWKAGIIAAVRSLSGSYGNHIIENVGGSSVYYAHLARAIVSAGQSVSQGQTIGYSDSTGNSTGPHLHFEIRGGNAGIGSGGGGGILAALSPAKYLAMVTDALGKLSSIRNTPWGQMVAGVATKLAGSVKDKITSLASSFVGAAGSAFTSVTGGSNRAIGKRMMLQRWGAGEWPALNSLWTKESGWNERALNRSSGAYGIPQSLPGSKMASAGADWRTNPATQIKWGLGYIASRYGSPSSAWRHSQRTNWYGNGGLITEPVIGMGMRSGRSYGFGEHGTETVTPGRGGRGINIYVDLGEGLVRRVEGILDEHDEFHASVGRMHR